MKIKDNLIYRNSHITSIGCESAEATNIVVKITKHCAIGRDEKSARIIPSQKLIER